VAPVPSPVIVTKFKPVPSVYPVPPAVISILSIPAAVAESLDAFWLRYWAKSASVKDASAAASVAKAKVSISPAVKLEET